MEKTKNTFQDGLIMDFSPDNTGATSLTSALNATILTFNGNEMALLNDMGNGRVETAYLPEGYVPVGTCEFGDIIYIVSYNPLSNLAQIGCFPSPERNISSEEIGDMKQSLSSSDFLIMNNNVPTGELKSTSVKKVLIDNRTLNPGDKYVIYSNNVNSSFSTYFSDFGNSNKDYIKLSVVSIDDSGKITYLDTTTKWYKVDNTTYKIMLSSNDMTTVKLDIDSYRNLVTSGWSIFSSKVSGKLAILAELNMIETFSCLYSIDVQQINNSTKYIILFKPSFNEHYNEKVYLSVDNISFPTLVTTSLYGTIDPIITSFTVNGELNPSMYIYPGYPLNDGNIISGIISNLYSLTVSIDVPYYNNKEILKSPELVFSCDIIPAMAYGKLDHLKIPVSIDLNKVGSGEIIPIKWRYHNSENTCILQYGFDIYSKPNLEVKSLSIDFYDNTGLAARYYIDGYDSYSGVITEYFGLEGENYNHKLQKVINGQQIFHKGAKINREEIPVTNISYVDNLGNKTTDTSNIVAIDGTNFLYLYYDGSYYINDAGTLYSNILYATIISINSGNIDSSDYTETKKFYRWLWTNSMYNEYYYIKNDFDDLKFLLNLDVTALFESRGEYKWENKVINNLGNNIDNGTYTTYSSNVQYIGLEEVPNVNMYIQAGLLNDYGCFNLLYDDGILGFGYDIYLGLSLINYSSYDNTYEFSEQTYTVTPDDANFLAVKQIINSNTTNGTSNYKYINLKEPINTSKIILNDDFNVNFYNPSLVYKEDIEDYGTYYKISGDLNSCYYVDSTHKKSIPLHLAASIFTKALTTSRVKYTGDCPVYSPIISNEQEMNNLGIVCHSLSNSEFSLRFNSAVAGETYDTAKCYSLTPLIYNSGKFDKAEWNDKDKLIKADMSLKSYTVNDYTDKVYSLVEGYLSLFFMLYPMSDGNAKYVAVRGNNGLEKVNQSLFYVGSFNNYIDYKSCLISTSCANINDNGTIVHLKESNSTGILCMKLNDVGFVAFNNYTLDSGEKYSEGEGTAYYLNFAKKDSIKETQYANLSIPLYILLSRIYTKNKTIPLSTSLYLNNYVKLSPYSTYLTKNIIVKLYETDQSKTNIVMRGVNYNEYKDNLLKQIDNISNFNQDNITLEFTNVAKNVLLSLEVYNKSIDFISSDDRALFVYNGSTNSCTKIYDEQFYIYYNGELIPYQDLKYLFTYDEIYNNLRSIITSIPISDSMTFNYITVALTLVEDERKDAINALSSAIDHFIGTNPFWQYCNDYILAGILYNLAWLEGEKEILFDRLLRELVNCFANPSGSDYYYSSYINKTYEMQQMSYLRWLTSYPDWNINYLMGYAESDSLASSIKKTMNLSMVVSNGYITAIDSVSSGGYRLPDTYISDSITITPELSLSLNFLYDGTLSLRNKSNHNYLKLFMQNTSKPLEISKGLECIMKDISLDTTYKITK